MVYHMAEPYPKKLSFNRGSTGFNHCIFGKECRNDHKQWHADMQRKPRDAPEVYGLPLTPYRFFWS